MRDGRREKGGLANIVRVALWSVLLSALPAIGCVLESFDDLTRVGVESPSAARCGECHVQIFAEFNESAHAGSWTRPEFVEATSGRIFEACLGCHAPETVYSEGPPRLRADHREEGVSCVSCHFDGGVLAGPAPRSALLEPHPVAEHRQLYLEAELCGKCHEGTYREWQEAESDDRRTCQDCHMKPVTRKLTQATGPLSSLLVSFEDEYEGRAHSFHLGAIDDFEGAITSELLAVERRDGQVRVDLQLVNRLPHLIPTGDFGFRRATVQFVGRNTAGEVVATQSDQLFKEMGQALVPDEPRHFRQSFAADVTRLHLSVVVGKRSSSEHPVLDVEWQLP